MNERYEEIEHAIQNIHRNLFLLRSNANPEVELMINKASVTTKDLIEDIQNIKKAEYGNNIHRINS